MSSEGISITVLRLGQSKRVDLAGAWPALRAGRGARSEVRLLRGAREGRRPTQTSSQRSALPRGESMEWYVPLCRTPSDHTRRRISSRRSGRGPGRLGPQTEPEGERWQEGGLAHGLWPAAGRTGRGERQGWWGGSAPRKASPTGAPVGEALRICGRNFARQRPCSVWALGP